jgi:hypothetical protein
MGFGFWVLGFGFWVLQKRGHELHELYTNFYVVEDYTNFICRWQMGFGLKKRGHELHELYTNFYVVNVKDYTNFICRWQMGLD